MARIAALVVITAALSAFAAAPIGAAPAGGQSPEAASSQLFEDGTGFQWGRKGNSLVMERTHDQGKTWSELDLSALSIDLGALSISDRGLPAPVSVHFADPGHGWLVWSTDDSVLHIASTADSGTSWRSVLTLGTDAIPGTQVFPGPGRACLLAEMPEGMMHTTMVTLATDDDGATWTASSIEHGDGMSSCTFRNATDGFLSIFYPSGVSIIFYRTTDGGKSWQSVDIPLPPGLDPDDPGGTSPGIPVFSGPQQLNGELTVQLYLPGGWKNFTYRSTDGGETWTYSE